MVGRGSTNQGDFTPLGRAFLQAAPPLFNCMRVSAKRLGLSSIFSFGLVTLLPSLVVYLAEPQHGPQFHWPLLALVIRLDLDGQEVARFRPDSASV